MSDSDQSHRGHASIFTIKLPNNVCFPKVLDTYIPVDYSEDIDDGVFDYANYGKTVS